jgi:Ca2+-binding RTX toxin-like protein
VSKDVIFIDSRAGGASLVSGQVGPDTEIILLDGTQDGLKQMALALAGRTGLDSVQLISHGAAGTLLLGNTLLTSDNLAGYQSQLWQIGASLADGGDLLLYGCDVAQGEGGQRFIDALALATGADVAASTDLSGPARLGGNWTLEAAAGTVETASLGVVTDSALGLYIGTSGNDTLQGGYGSDTILGGDGDDYISGSYYSSSERGGDHLDGGTGNDLIWGSFENDLLIGGAGDDTLESGSGLDTVQGGDGDDRINMGSYNGDQLIDGGAGNDTIGADGNDTVTGGDGNDLIYCTSWTDRAVLLQVDGGAGDDTIHMLSLPKPGQQMLATGGSGSDTFVARMYDVNGQNVVTDFSAGPGGDRIDVSQLLIQSTYFGMTTAINPFNASYGYLRLVQDGGDTLLQYDADGIGAGAYGYQTALVLRNVIASSLTKENFTDLISPDGGKIGGQVVTTPNALGVLQGSFYNDTITGGIGANTLVGGYGNDLLQGGNQPDGTSGDDMAGGEGNDTLTGGTGNDTLSGNKGSDYVDGGAGDDDLISGGVDGDGGNGVDTLIGGDGNDTLSFSGLFYNGAPVIINGGAGDDVIDAWSGASFGGVSGILTGGSGSDTFGTRSSSLWSVDNIFQVTDFKAGAGGDRVDAEGLLSYEARTFKTNPWLTGSGFVRLVQSGADTLVQHDIDGVGGVKTFVTVLVLQNVNASQLTQANWMAHLHEGGTGDNTLYGGFGADTLSGAGGNDVLDGGVGDNLLLGGSGDDTLLAGAGADRLDAGVGADVVDGGAGNDTLTVLGNFADYVLARPSSADTLLVNQATGEHILLRNIETVIFADGARAIAGVVASLGSTGADLLTGTGGADTLDGLAGSDTMSGGAGDDVYVVDAAGDVVNEGVNAGADRVDTVLTAYTLGANVENLRHIGGAAFSGTGNELNNLIEGGGGNDVLLGAAGMDTLLGNAGKDRLDGGAGDDVLAGGAGDDTLLGGADNDALNAGSGTGFDLADGGAGIDTLTVSGNFSSYVRTRLNATDLVLVNAATAESVTLRNIENVVFADGVKTMAQILTNLVTGFDDVVAGDDGANVLDGGKGNDTMTGGKGDDVYTVDAVGDVIVENADGGTDSVNVALTAAGTYVLGANVENATVTAGSSIAVGLTGNESANILTGNAAANTLTGGAGNDTLDGGGGADKLTGNTGDDTYVVDVAGDTVTELAGEGTDTVRTSLATYTLTANVENLAYTGTAAFSGTGNALDNVITGGNAGNKLDGGAGNDQLIGGSGADNLIGGLGDDTFTGAAGKDTVDGGAGVDLLQGLGKFGDYVVTRPTANDTVLTDGAGNVITVRGVENFAFADGDKTLAQVQDNIASVGNDSLQGTDGNDVLNGGLGVDTLSGGLGDDTYVLLNAADAVVENAGEGIDLVQVALTTAGGYTLAANVDNATVTAAASLAVNLTGNELGNVLTGNAAANTLTGGAGNDTLDGAAGADKLVGGSGDDTYVVADAGDTVTELAGEGTDTVRTSLATYTLTANVENLAYTGTAAFTGTGNLLDNVITGGNAGNKLDGGAGNDKLTGGNGADSLIGGLGDDTFNGATGKDTVDGGAGVDLLQGLGKFGDYIVTRPTANDTVLTDGAGNVITVRGVENFSFADGDKTLAQVQDNIASPGNDSLRGTDGNDVLNGGLGVDTLSGGLGDDTYVLLNAADVVVENGGEGIDLVQLALTAAGSHTLAADVENATVTAVASIAVSITGNELDNILTGNAATNTLTGGAGNDTLDGAAGADKLVGGSGDDTYVVDVAGDVVTELAGEGTDTVRTSLATYTLTANVEDLAYAGTAAFTATGNALDNVITGGNAGNKLDGGAGNDQLTGGKGADNLIGGLGDDTFIGTAGKDTIDGGAGDDLLVIGGKFADYVIARPTANDVVLTDKAGNVLTVRNVEGFEFSDGTQALDSVLYNVPSLGNDQLYGTAGADTLDGGTGADTMNGNDGDDTYLIDNVGDVIEEGQYFGTDVALVALASAGTYTLGGDVEIAKVTSAASVAVNLTGNDVDNLLTGNAAANTLIGGGGNDTLDGAAGSDRLLGGSGDDTYVVDVAGDVVTELEGEGSDTVRTSLASYTLAANVENLAYTGKTAFTGTGNALDNILTGGNAGNKLDGGAGNDRLAGGNGADNLIGGLGDDTFVGATGKDTIDGGGGIDVLTGLGARADYVLTRPNADDVVLTDKAGNVLTARNVEQFEFSDGPQAFDTLVYNVPSIGKDLLYGTAGADTMDGGAGADTMDGSDGDDTYLIDNVGDVIIEGQYFGTDVALVALATAGTYTLAGDVEIAKVTSAASVAVNLTGNDGDNLLTGNAAANTLSGAGGNDTLDGGAGSDKLLGGDGDDVYLVNDAGDVITEAVDAGRDAVRTSLASYTLAANVELLNYTGTAAFTGTGNAVDNEITGGNFGNKLDGGAGNDTLVGGTGNDSLLGGAGDDQFFGGGGNDTIDGGQGDDRLWVQSLAHDQVTVTRVSGTDTVLTDSTGKTVSLRNVESVEFSDGRLTLDELQYNLPSPGGDHLYGGGAADTLNGGLGADTLEGGGGDDTYVIADKAAVVLESEDGGIDTVQVALTAAGTYTLADNVENATVTAAASVAVILSGNALDNKLIGNAAANTLNGGAGDDTLDGGAGADQMAGGAGNDIYVVTESGDVVAELAGGGTDTVITILSTYTLGANVELLFYAGSGMFTGTGNALDNFMSARDGGSRLDGGGGDDFLVGGAGSDTLSGGVGDDQFDASAGVDTIDGGAGSDTVWGLDDYRNYTIVRLNATDTLLTHYSGAKLTVRNVESFDFGGDVKSMAQMLGNSVGPGSDTVFGSAGADILDGGAGDDLLVGRGGDDLYKVSSPGDITYEEWNSGHDMVEVGFATAGTYVMDVNLEDAIITGTAAVNIVGNWENNYLGGNAAANNLRGSYGDDTLVGGAGSDTMAGEAGDDIYVVADSGDVVRENAGEGYETVFTKLGAYTLTANVEDLVYDGTGTFSGKGNDGANRLFAVNGSGATLDGAGGDDLLVGGAGNDSLAGGSGDDQFQASGGKDTIDGGAGLDTFYGMTAFSSYSVFRANSTDTVLADGDGHVYTVRNVENFYFSGVLKTLAQVQQNTASTGADQLSGTDGNDTLDGGAGADTMAGGYGNDVYVVDNVNDKVVETADGGYDSVLVAPSTAGTYVMAANVEHAVVTSALGAGAVNVTGNELDNEITGNAAANKLIGGDGADLLDGGAGSDVLTGGAGADMFVLNSLVGTDTVTDFVSGTDHLLLNLAGLGVGNRDLLLDGATTRAAPGGFAHEAELVLFSARMASASAANAAAVIGSASSAYAVGDTALFAVSTGTATSLYLFKSSGADAVVSAAELTQVAVLTGTPTTVLADYLV